MGDDGEAGEGRAGPWSRYAIAAGVLAVVQVVLGPLATIGALVTGHKALRDVKRSVAPVKGRGVAIAAVSVSYLLAVMFTIAGIAYLTKDDPPPPYPASARTDFMQRCNLSPRSACACQFRELRRRVDYERYQDLAAAGRLWMDPLDIVNRRALDTTPDEVLSAATVCFADF